MNKKRHIKPRRKKTWTDLRVEISKICGLLNISTNEFSEVNSNQWNEIEHKIWAKFSTKNDSRWIWETLKDSYSAAPIDYNDFALESLIDTSEKVWFLLDETVNEKTKFWIYEGTIKSFSKIFQESGLTDEIVIVSKKYEWIFIINHHDMMIGTGQLVDKIEKIKSR
ncbi:DUF6756 family protein [Kordia sp. SMS9]|uniref:DUF6756 family protein n=1 Tax=Kordia sp. SMS9 TaxID=2282170 RepID=UPI0019652758|nr:DUF6756 family protein [Kordia sp. SMS9]